MSPFAKRQRLYAQVDRGFPQSFDSEEAYYDTPPDDEMADFVDDEEEEEGGGGEEPDLDNDSLFQERRARLDHKLKSTFESIFEKYGKDFEGIGDEIDMATGEIVVNNGHLMGMQDERDVGQAFSSDALSESADELVEGHEFDVYESSEQDDEGVENEEEGVGDQEDYESYDEGIDYESDGEPDDDLIIRGPTAGVQRMFPSDSHRDMGKDRPFGSEILAEFGPKMGQRVLAIVSQMHAPDDRHIEPAWRVPEIPTARPTKRPAVKAVPLFEDTERSPSPEASTSLWAPLRKHGSRGQKRRVIWTPEEDKILLKAVSRGLRNGRRMMTILVELATKYPGKNWWNWQSRYDKLIAAPNRVGEPPDDSDLTSEVSVFRAPAITKLQNANGFPAQVTPPESNRPIRIRKPAQTDPAIRTWQEAVPLLDPEEHAELLEDDRRMVTSKPRFDHTEYPQRTYSALQAQPDNETWVEQYDKTQSQQKDPAPRLESIEATPEIEQPFIAGAPCGHVDCKNSKTKYKLQQRVDEEISEMNLHLFKVHHMAPYPCSEANCLKTGLDGFFRQEDLVAHVRGRHPGVEAWRRLRGRVSSELLDRSPKKNIARQSQATDVSKRLHDHQQVSNSISPSKTNAPRTSSSSGARSSNFDPDRTMTPRMADGAYHSTLTPMTSVSSMRVHPSSGNMQQGRHHTESLEPLAHAHQGSVELEGTGHFYFRQEKSYSSPEEHSAPRMSSTEGSVSIANTGSDNVPKPPRSMEISPQLHTTLAHSELPSTVPESELELMHEYVPTLPASLATGNSSFRTQDHQSVLQEISNSSPIPSTQDSCPVQDHSILKTKIPVARELPIRSESPFIYTRTSQTSVKPLTTPSEAALKDAPQAIGVSPVVSAVSAVQLSMSMTAPTEVSKLPQVPQTTLKATPKTNEKPKAFKVSSLTARPKQTPPHPQKQTKTAFRKLFKGSEIDELSLDDDDLKLLSIKKRRNPRLDFVTQIKREGTSSPQVLSAMPVKKRKLGMMLGSDEIDELGSDPVDIWQPVIQPTIKQEEDDAVPRVTSSTKSIGKESNALANFQSGPGPSNTPLLDLTPSRDNREQEIRDSADVSSPATRKEVATSSSPIEGLLTPVGQKGWDENFHKQFKIPVTVRTPGGTLRSCGVEGFRCGKFICHRCASAAREHAI